MNSTNPIGTARCLSAPRLWRLVRRAVCLALCSGALAVAAAELHVAPGGDDAHPGTAAAPLRSLEGARRAARAWAGREPVRVVVAEGTYSLPDTLRFEAADSGSATAPISYEAAPGARPVLSGGQVLALPWRPWRAGILQATTPAGLVMDQLFVNGRRLPMARYPDFDPAVRHFNGYAPDAISEARVARWSDPAGGYIHAMHNALWGDMHWIIRGKDAGGGLRYEGGWQNNRPSAMHRDYRFVENILEELDAPGEWYHDARTGTLYLHPEAGTDPASAVLEAVRLAHLVEFRGTRDQPVRHLRLRGFTFRHTARTFMENREPLLRSDWTVYRGGAVVYAGTEDCVLEDATFDQVGGNTVFVDGYTRRLTVRRCLIRDSGANGIAFVGDPRTVRSPLFNYNETFDYSRIDRTPGPRGEEYPADCLVEDCLITRTGRFEKQTAPIQISMARRITVRHCSIYEVPRAGINISEGTWGGHVIEHCDVFDTVLETGDHGSFNSWGRDRFWHPRMSEVDRQVARDPTLPYLDAGEPVLLRHNRWRCDHGWDIDLDDGSTNYRIEDNLLLHGGLKLREGFGRLVSNNVILNNSLHPHCWYARSGDVFQRNIVMGPYRPAGGMPVDRWGASVDGNLFTTSEADRTRFAAQGCDAHSVVGDPMFVDPERGDFRVRDGSPALALGFRNFAMDDFGVRDPDLRAIARTPAIPGLAARPEATSAAPRPEVPVITWRGARMRDLAGEDYSAYGVPKDAGGILLVNVPERAEAHREGFRSGDVILGLNGRALSNLGELARGIRALEPGDAARFEVRRDQAPVTVTLPAGLEPPRI